MFAMPGRKRVLNRKGLAAKALKNWSQFMDSEAAVDEYLADQLLLPIALNHVGSFSTVKPSLHTLTQIKVLESFLDIAFDIKSAYGKKYLIVCR